MANTRKNVEASATPKNPYRESFATSQIRTASR